MKDIEKIYRTALGDNPDSTCAAQVLLSLWDGAQYKIDLQLILICNDELFTAIKTALSHLFVHKHQLNQYVTDQEMVVIEARYGNQSLIG